MYSGIGARLSADWDPIWLYVGTLPAGDNPTKQWRPESLQSVLPSMITESRLWPSGDKIQIKLFTQITDFRFCSNPSSKLETFFLQQFQA